MHRLKVKLQERSLLPFTSPPRSESPPMEDLCDSDDDEGVQFSSSEQVKTPKTRVIHNVSIE